MGRQNSSVFNPADAKRIIHPKLAKCTEKVSTTTWRLKKVLYLQKYCSPTRLRVVSARGHLRVSCFARRTTGKRETARSLQSNKLRPLTTASMTKTGTSSYKLITASLALAEQGTSPMCLGLITFPLTYTPSALTSASPRSGDQDSWQDLDTIWIQHDN